MLNSGLRLNKYLNIDLCKNRIYNNKMPKRSSYRKKRYYKKKSYKRRYRSSAYTGFQTGGSGII